MLMLKRDWPGAFRRTVNGQRLSFLPGEPVDLPEEQKLALAEDIGPALVPCDEQGKPVKFSEDDLKRLRLKAEKARAAARAAAGGQPKAEGRAAKS